MDEKTRLLHDLTFLTGQVDTDWLTQPVSVLEAMVDGLQENQTMVTLDNVTMAKLNCLGDAAQAIQHLVDMAFKRHVRGLSRRAETARMYAECVSTELERIKKLG